MKCRLLPDNISLNQGWETQCVLLEKNNNEGIAVLLSALQRLPPNHSKFSLHHCSAIRLKDRLGICFHSFYPKELCEELMLMCFQNVQVDTSQSHTCTCEGQLSTGQGAAHVTLSWGMAQPLEPSPPSERALKQKLTQKDRVRTKLHMAGQTLRSNVTQQLDFNHICCLLGLQDFVFLQVPSSQLDPTAWQHTACSCIHLVGKAGGNPAAQKWDLLPLKQSACEAAQLPAHSQQAGAALEKQQQWWKEPSPHRGLWWKLTEGICPIF